MFHRGGEGFTRKGCATLLSWWFEEKISRFPDFVQVEDLVLCNGHSKLQLFSRKVSNHDGKKKDVHILHLHPYPLPPSSAASNNPASCADVHVLDLASHPLQNALKKKRPQNKRGSGLEKKVAPSDQKDDPQDLTQKMHTQTRT